MSDVVGCFPFVARDPTLGNASLVPMLPCKLSAKHSLETMALLDTGAALNVLPNTIGIQLGYEWDKEHRPVTLTGNLASIEARVVVISVLVGKLQSVRLAFAWAKIDSIPIILGQVNFFLEFDVCFFRSRGLFEVRAKSKLP